jgi:hypothetical protein
MMHIRDAKALWDHLNTTYGASDAGKELYIMESFHDYKMVANKSIVEQAHEIQRLAKELELLKYVIPDEVVAGCIIAKLPSPWRNFATSLKHKRVKITVENLIQSLDVEEKARAKDNTDKGDEKHSASAHFVQKNFKGKNKGKGKQQPFNAKATTTFKKKKKKDKFEMPCFTCGELGHFAKDCPKRADRKEKRSTSWLHQVLMTGMVIFLLYFQYFNHLVGGLIWVLIFTCVMTSLCFLLTRGSKVLLS